MIPFLLNQFVIHKVLHHLLLDHIHIHYSKSHPHFLLIMDILRKPLHHLHFLIPQSNHLQLHHLFQSLLHLSIAIHFHSIIDLKNLILHLNQHHLEYLIIIPLSVVFFFIRLDEHIHRLVRKFAGHSFAVLRNGSGV